MQRYKRGTNKRSQTNACMRCHDADALDLGLHRRALLLARPGNPESIECQRARMDVCPHLPLPNRTLLRQPPPRDPTPILHHRIVLTTSTTPVSSPPATRHPRYNYATPIVSSLTLSGDSLSIGCIFRPRATSPPAPPPSAPPLSTHRHPPEGRIREGPTMTAW